MGKKCLICGSLVNDLTKFWCLHCGKTKLKNIELIPDDYLFKRLRIYLIELIIEQRKLIESEKRTYKKKFLQNEENIMSQMLDQLDLRIQNEIYLIRHTKQKLWEDQIKSNK